MDYPDNLKYTKEHEWVKVDGATVTVGITDYAQEQLGDIVYLELPKEGQEVERDEPFGVVESVKAVSDVYAPISGTVVELNDPLTENPATINEDCYEEGWLIRVKIKNKKELDDLMDHTAYHAFVEESAK